MRSDEKKAILLIVKTAAQLKTDDINELNAVLGYAKESKLFTGTVFGKRFIQRLEELKKKTDYEHKCILCGHPVTGIICNTCMEQLLPAVEKEYAGDISVEAKEESQNTFGDHIANQKSVQNLEKIMYALLFLCVFNMVGMILILLMLKGVIV
ncbi:MAG: hypothetical protein MR663_12490 [Lachnospiraceae bacterium]|nr:hypothetical protein [Lachnospiraceae bacterium]